MLKNRLIYGIIILLLAGFYVATSSQKILILLILFITAFVTSIVLLLIGKSKMKVDLVLPLWKQENIRLKLNKETVLPMGLIRMQIKYENGLYQDEKIRNVDFYPEKKGTTEYLMPWAEEDCGNFHIDSVKMNICDMMGIVTVPGKVSIPRDHVVYPDIPHVESTQGIVTKSAKEGERYDLFRSGNDRSEVFALRDYEPGDSLNRIHWKLSGKIDKLIVREFGKPSNEQTTILCDPAFGKYRNNHDLVNGVFGITASISRSLTANGVNHQVCGVQGDLFVEKKIKSQDDVLDILTEFMHMHLKKAEDAYNYWKMYEKTERSILVTGYLDDEFLAELGEDTDLVVVLLTNAENEELEVRDQYRILGLPINKLQGNIQKIEI